MKQRIDVSLIQKNSRKQGDVGLGKAISYFTSLGYSVSIPLTESQRYDLIVDDGESLYRIECKTSRFANQSGNMVIELRTKGGYNESTRGDTRNISSLDSDYVFASTPRGCWLIPTETVSGMTRVVLGGKYKEFKVYEGMVE